MWGERISPVFDAAERLLLLDAEDGREVRRSEATLSGGPFGSRARQLSALGVEVLICGAISRPLEAMVAAQGIQVVAQVCGPLEEVAGAFLDGRLDQERFLMPGCCGRRWRARRGRGRGRQAMPS